MAEEIEKSEMISDPCQIPIRDKVTGDSRICGAVKRSLIPHLKMHNEKNTKAKDRWTAKRYRKEFPDFSLGAPTFVHSKEQIDKFLEAGERRTANIRDAKQVLEQADENESRINIRFNELWDQVNRDVPARQWAMEAARAEERIEEINRRYDSAFKRGDYKRLEPLMKELISQQKVLKECMDFLDLTVKNRREKNQLGNDTVSQLISNFGATLRRWSPERQQTFQNRIKEVRRIQAERIRMKAQDLLDERVEEIADVKPMTDRELDDKIQTFIESARS